jgi:hypothetical protein
MPASPPRPATFPACRCCAAPPSSARRRLTVTAWKAADFDLSTRAFANDMGLLEGGLTVLAIFMLLAALVNREPLYIVFAAWLIVNARLGANSAGWDTLWLGHQVPTAWLDGMRKIIFASNFPLTVYLFTRLFQNDIGKVGKEPLLRVLELLYLPMFAAALLLPYRTSSRCCGCVPSSATVSSSFTSAASCWSRARASRCGLPLRWWSPPPPVSPRCSRPCSACPAPCPMSIASRQH